MARTRQQTRASESKEENTKDSKPLTKEASKPASKPTPKKPRSTTVPATAQQDKHESLPNESSAHAENADVLDFTSGDGTSTISCNIRPSPLSGTQSTMIFTHGAGGTISTPSVANFADGFASECTAKHSHSQTPVETSVSSITCFNGTMNLKSRTQMFHRVADHLASGPEPLKAKFRAPVFGGTSMGARAAVMAANEIASGSEARGEGSGVKLVLASYPLEGQNGKMRDEILLDIDEDVEVFFMIGTKDSMCDLAKLDEVRRKMKAKSWLLTVEGASHGLACREKKRTREMQMAAGRVAAAWARNHYKGIAGDVGGMEGYVMNMCLPVETGKKTQGTAAKDSSKGDSAKKRQRTEEDEEPEAASKKKKKGKKPK